MDDAFVSAGAAEILRVIRDRAASPRALGPEGHVADLLRGRVLERVAAALSADGLTAMLVKGAALALTVYPPGSRSMNDVDLLVRRRDRARAIRALERAGFVRHPARDRPFSGERLGEAQFTVDCGVIPSVVEVHTSLDKIAPRPLSGRGLFERAQPAPSAKPLAGLLVPSPEDHALLVAIHAAGNELRHAIGLLDMELLLRSGLDRRALVARSREARLTSVMFLVTATLRALGAASVDDALVAAFDPGPLRRAAIAGFYDVGSYPVARGPLRLGLPWIVRQTPLRDDLLPWARGLAAYAALRAADHLAPRGLSGGVIAAARARSRA